MHQLTGSTILNVATQRSIFSILAHVRDGDIVDVLSRFVGREGLTYKWK